MKYFRMSVVTVAESESEDYRPNLRWRFNNDIISPDQQLNAASPNHNQQYQQPNVPSPNHQQQYDNAISNYSDNITNSPDKQPNVSSPSHNQQYHQHSVASPNHQQQYDASYQQYIYQTAISNNTDSIIPGHNHHQQPSNNNNPDSNNTNHNNNQQSSSADIPPLSLNITINSPQTNFIIIPSSDMIQQVLACLNNSSSGFQR
ncbi:6161_t:CDS:2, partial [Rhizophagus irregularis]